MGEKPEGFGGDPQRGRLEHMKRAGDAGTSRSTDSRGEATAHTQANAHPRARSSWLYRCARSGKTLTYLQVAEPPTACAAPRPPVAVGTGVGTSGRATLVPVSQRQVGVSGGCARRRRTHRTPCGGCCSVTPVSHGEEQGHEHQAAGGGQRDGAHDLGAPFRRLLGTLCGLQDALSLIESGLHLGRLSSRRS